MKDSVTLKELAAIAVRRGKQILLFAFVFALLLAGLQAIRLFSSSRDADNGVDQLDVQYQEKLAAYTQQKLDLEHQLRQLQQKMESQQEYSEKSLLMKIDPYNKAVTTVNIAISGVGVDALQRTYQLNSSVTQKNADIRQTLQLDNTVVDFMTAKIQSQYQVLWNSLDLQEALSAPAYQSVEDKYLREVLSLETTAGGILTLKATADTEYASKRLADAAYTCLQEQQPLISGASAPHGFTILSKVTKVVIDQALDDAQKNSSVSANTYMTQITGLEQQLNSLTEPEQQGKRLSLSVMFCSCVKHGILGAALGIALALIWVLTTYIFRNRVETSRQLEQDLSIPFLGSAAGPARLWDRLADRILGERNWTDSEQALAYISGNAKSCLPHAGAVALISTLPLQKENPAVQSAIKALAESGCTVRFLGDADHNPETSVAVRESSCIVLAERAGATRWTAVTELATLAKRLDRPMGGFITI